jgi:hypothetical protein
MTKKTSLRLIKGGKVKRGEPPKGKRGKKERRQNPLNRLLWYATSRAYYPSRATGVEMIAERMTKLSKRVMGREMTIATSTANEVIYDGRRRKRAYGWMLLNAEKGSIGWMRGYVPVLTDVDEEDTEIFLIDDQDLKYAIKGIQSAIRTEESMIVNTADGITFLINCLEALGSRAAADEYREFAAECRAFARRAAEVRKNADAL